MRFDENELALFRSLFGSDESIKLLRKLFLPEYDPHAPLGQVVDLWLTLDIADQEPEEAKRRILARNDLIKHVESCLLQIKTLSKPVDSEEVKKEKAKKNSLA